MPDTVFKHPDTKSEDRKLALQEKASGVQTRPASSPIPCPTESQLEPSCDSDSSGEDEKGSSEESALGQDSEPSTQKTCRQTSVSTNIAAEPCTTAAVLPAVEEAPSLPQAEHCTGGISEPSALSTMSQSGDTPPIAMTSPESSSVMNGAHQDGSLGGSDTKSPCDDIKIDLSGNNTEDNPQPVNGNLRLQELPAVKYSPGKDEEEEEKEEEEESSSCCCRRKRAPAIRTVGFFELFRFASKLDWLLMVLGTLGAMASGTAIPINMVVYGRVINLFVLSALSSNGTVANGTDPNAAYANLYEEMTPFAIYFCIIGVASLVANYFSISLWSWTAERQGGQIRRRYFRAVMRQDMTWYDTHETGELNSRFSEDMHNIQEGLGDKVAVLLQWVTTWVASYVMALSQGWKLALATICFSPVIMVAGAVTMRFIRNTAAQELQAYAKAGAVAEQALRGIRTVHAFHGQEKEAKRFEDNLVFAKRLATRKGLFLGLGTSSFWVIIFFTFALALWYGVQLVQTENMPPGNILPIFFGVMIGSMSLAHAFPNLEVMATARGAAAKVYEIIDKMPDIDVSSPHGKVMKEIRGEVQFKDVHFHYPARPDVKVLRGVSFPVQPRQTVALVGPSGCGKSTLIQLLQRFYDPLHGQVLVDGHDLRELHLATLRSHLGVVSQEPVLFATSIAENIRFGRMEATQAQIEEAAIAANCHDFISQLPQGYETIVGERGAQLSGGQKQRIAIARALVRNPKILLLDEATSALDSQSESVVQEALEKAEEGRTTIVIAHRLSTIRNADVIVCISEGEVVEMGSHDSLMAAQGLYYQLVQLQSHVSQETDENLEDVEIVEEDEGAEVKDDPDILAKSTFQRPGSARSLVARSSFRRRSARLSSPKGKKGKGKKNKEQDNDVPPASLKRILRMNSPEWLFILTGCLTSIIGGCVHPAFSFIMSEFIRVFALRDQGEQSRLTVILCLVMVGIGVGVALIKLLQNYCFAKSGTYLTARMRAEAFRSTIQQDMEFFDDPRHQVSILTSRLASDAALVHGAAGVKLGNVLESLATVVCAVIIAFVYGWKLTLVVLCFMPIMIIAGIVQGKAMAGFAKSDKENVKNAGKIASEAIDNVRTVAGLTREDTFIHRFETALDGIYRNGRKRAQVFGVTYGLAQCIIFFAYATAFVYGSYLVQTGEMEFFEVFRVFAAIIFGGMSVGRNSSFTPDYTKGKLAAGRLFAIIDRKPKIDASADKGMKLEDFSGRVALNEVTFSYASRQTVQVLSGLSVDVFPGQTLALVGPSGCGKSTTVQLLERFYEPDTGSVTVDSQDIRNVHLAWLRSQMGLVSQEPTLFDCSIAENIAYGDNSRVVTMDEIIAAARSANIHEFIAALPQGYNTNAGDKGTQLSGGQKQRIAIARALVRNPKILLLDEATSALDSESERVVQEALDKARAGRTCLVIAHRLSTVKSADKIAVIQQGRVLEQGSHRELMAQKGAYYRLVQAQSQRKSGEMH